MNLKIKIMKFQINFTKRLKNNIFLNFKIQYI